MGPVAVLVWLVLEWGNAGGGLTPCPHGFIGGGLTPCVPAAPAVEFAGPLNAGMGSVCAGTVPTLTSGAPISFGRGSGAYCTKTVPSGLATSGIQPGDLVWLSANQPRVEWASASQLALLGEPAGTNYALNSEGFQLWTASGGVTVSSDYSLAPSGLQTADRVQFSGGAAVVNTLSETTALGAGPITISVYVRGTSGSGTVYLWDNNGASNAVACAYTSSAWVRCALSWTSAGPLSAPTVGCSSGVFGMPATCPANDVLVWGAQSEAATAMSSYMPTTSAAATRLADIASLPAVGSQYTQGSAALSFVPEGAGTGIWPAQLSFTNNSRMLYGNGPQVLFFDGTNNPGTAAGLVALTSKRYWSSWSTASGVTVRNASDGNQITSPFSAGTWTTDNNIELQGIAALYPSGLVYGICVDPSEARCR